MYSRGDNAQAILSSIRNGKTHESSMSDGKRLYTAQVFYYETHSK